MLSTTVHAEVAATARHRGPGTQSALDSTFVSLVSGVVSGCVGQRLSHVLAVDAPELPQQLLRSSIEQLRQHEAYFDDEIAPAPVATRGHAALAQPEPLPRLGSWRHAQPDGTVDGRHVDLRAERGFVNRHRHGHVNVVALAPEQRVRLDAHSHVQIAGLAAVPPDVTFAGHAN